MGILESIVSIIAGLVGIAAVLVPLVRKVLRRVTAQKTVYEHLARAIRQRQDNWCTIQYIAKEENLNAEVVHAALQELRKKGLVEMSVGDEATFWALSNAGIEEYLSS